MVRRSIEGGAGALPAALPLPGGVQGGAQSGMLTPMRSLMMRRASTGGCSRAGSGLPVLALSSTSTPDISLRGSLTVPDNP